MRGWLKGEENGWGAKRKEWKWKERKEVAEGGGKEEGETKGEVERRDERRVKSEMRGS